MGKFTLCFDCAKAIGGCNWSDHGKPVKGWDAEKFPPSGTKPYEAYFIKNCPEFVRDAYDGGTRRTPSKRKLTL